MTALSMALNAFGATVPISAFAEVADPLTLNAWLETHGGYECMDGDCNNLVLDAVTRMNASWTLVGESPPPPVAAMESALAAGATVYLAHVRNSSHFVLLTGTAGSGVFTANDPYYNATACAWSEIHDVITYAVSRSSPPAARAPVVPFPYPLYKQCDGAWGGDRIGNETEVTICDVGCLMSSIAMALARNNITVPDLGGSTHWATANPQSLNTWLQLHGGYVDGDDFDEGDLPALDPAHVAWTEAHGMHTKNDVPLPTVQALVAAGQPVIANVMHGGHFVLVVGWDSAQPDTLLVNDPGFPTASYSYSADVVGWRLFNMTARPSPGRS